ncbi:TIGR02186 family protein [Agrobacterium tumefaciens]|uniref:TIGR02186 family protein n=1 Tax=Agrobacterium tumefaciens TaxID=358 RepID=UPI002FD92637|nr:TIGR02186 family protein [Agrobacterium tumefaciens]
MTHRLLLCAFLLIGSCLAFTASAQTPPLALPPGTQQRSLQENIEIGASTTEIPITSDFRGADFTLFGALNNADQLLLAIGQYDIVVTLEGPSDYMTVRKKERVAGIWINTSAITFTPLPESYSMASTRDISAVASPGTLRAMGLGVEHLSLKSAVFSGVPDNVFDFQEAYRRLRLSSGIYRNDTTGVRLERTGLFWATLRLPANVPNGVHTARAYLFKSGNFIAQRELKLRVVKTGMEQAITDAAHQTPLAYGALCVLLAVVTGWSASIIFRKD